MASPLSGNIEIRRILAIKEEIEKLEKQIKDLREEEEGLQQLVVPFWASMGKTQEKITGLGTFFIKTSTFVSVDDDAKFEEWAKATGNYDSLRMISNGKLKSLYRSLEEAGQPLPSGVRSFTKAAISIRKEK
jgi:hypothetical protein